MKILVFGSNGQLGKSLKKNHKNNIYKILFKSKKQIDITDYNALLRSVIKNNPKIIINCAAFTNVDLCEIQKRISRKINSSATKNLLSICKKFNIFLIHLSTDYVFNSNKLKKFSEDDHTNPVNYYGFTKLLGEQKIISSNIPSIIIRTSFLYSNYSKNFYTKILKALPKNKKLFVVNDIISSPTNANDLSKAIFHIINYNMYSKVSKPTLFHFANSGYCSRYQFVKFIIKNIDHNISLKPIKSSAYSKSQTATRPKFSILDNRKFQNFFKYKIKNWKSSLKSELKCN